MKKSFLTQFSIILLIVISLQSFAQNYAIQRGHTADDLYIYCRKNATSNSIMQLYHLWEHGRRLSVQYTIPYPSTDNDLNLKNFVADPTPGLLFCTSLTNADTCIYKSNDSGKTWHQMNSVFTGLVPPIALLGGSVAGEIIMTERPTVQYYGIGSTVDFFTTHMLNAQYTSYFTKPEIGIGSGEIFGINNAYTSNRDFLLRSPDFGVTIDTLAIDSALVFNPNGNSAHKVCHGTQAGEIYLVTLEPEQSGFPHVYRIYHSTDYGATYSFRSEMKFEESSSFTDFSGGREDCSFYVVNWKFSQQLQRQIMQVYYSSDCGQTYTLYEHDLDAFVNTSELISLKSDNLTVKPNPAQDQFAIEYLVKTGGLVSITLSSADGKKSEQILNKYHSAGLYDIKIDCRNFSPGLYMINLQQDNIAVDESKLIICR